jgi:hypothetical protein
LAEQGQEILACYIWVHRDTPNPFVEGMLELEGPVYCSEIHATSINDVDTPLPPVDAEALYLLQTTYADHMRVDKALGELGDHSLIAEVNRYCCLERRRQGF